MSRISLVPNEEAQGAAKGIFEALEKKRAVINMFRVLAHKPDVLGNLLPFYTAITGPGSVAPEIKEFVYLKTSMVNACDY